MTEEIKEMPKYKSHKTVWALKIADLQHSGTPDQESDGSMWMVPEESGYARIHFSREYVQKHKPEVGGYYVLYKDGYKSFSPADAFEDGYTKQHE